MPGPIPLNFIKGDKIGPETDYRDFLPENMIGIYRPMFGAAGYMVQRAGLRSFGSAQSADRGAVWNTRQLTHFRLSGAQLVTVDENGKAQARGQIDGLEQGAMPFSFNTQAVIANGEFHLFDPVNGFRKVTDPDVGIPIDGVWLQNLYVLTDGDRIYHTELNDEESISAVDFATAEILPDPAKGLGVMQDDKLMVFGRQSIEFFVFQSTTTFLFQRIASRTLRIGLVATHGKVELDQIWYFIGGRKEGSIGIHAIGIGTTTQVSTREIDKLIAKDNEAGLADVRLEARRQDGYAYLIVHLPDDTVMLNVTLAEKLGSVEQAWTRLRTGIDSQPTITLNEPRPNFWRGINGIYEPRVGEWIYGDREKEMLGLYDDTMTSDFESPSEWALRTPFIYLDSTSINHFELEILPGHTLIDDAQARLSLTYDGVTETRETTLTYGRPGKFSQRLISRRLGYIRNWVAFNLRGSSQSPAAFGRGFVLYG